MSFSKLSAIHLRRMSGKILFAPSERNKDPILSVLKKHIDPSTSGHALEISSGTGQHVSHFAPHFPNLTFQPSEVNEALFDSIIAYASGVNTNNVRKPIKIDAATDYKTWNLHVDAYDYLININMTQVSPFNCTLGLFRAARNILKPTGLMIVYGPLAFNGVIEPQSNVNFDKELKGKNPEWGIRDLTDLKEIAKGNGIGFLQLHDLPANNKCTVWQKS